MGALHPPRYIKKLKMEILAYIASSSNVYEIVNELTEYTRDINPAVAREAVKAVGRIALMVRGRGAEGGGGGEGGSRSGKLEKSCVTFSNLSMLVTLDLISPLKQGRCSLCVARHSWSFSRDALWWGLFCATPRC